MAHQIELVPGVEGADGIRLDGTLYPAAAVAQALRDAPRLQAAAECARVAVALADAHAAVRGRMAPVASHPAVGRLLGLLDTAQAQAWADLAELLGASDDGPRVPRR